MHRLWCVSEPNKETIRQQLRAQRRALGAAGREEQMSRITEELLPWLEDHAPRRSVTCFLSYGSEPPTAALLERLDEAGYLVHVPICEPARRLSWTRWFPGVAMNRSAVGPIDEPVGERRGAEMMADVDVIMVPAQAVDEHGDRLGQGGGYYDRFIAELPGPGLRPQLISIVFDHEFLAPGSFPVELFDQRVDAVVTPAGVRNLTT